MIAVRDREPRQEDEVRGRGPRRVTAGEGSAPHPGSAMPELGPLKAGGAVIERGLMIAMTGSILHVGRAFRCQTLED